MDKSIDSKQISVRDITEEDVPLIRNYWFHSPSGFIESLGVDFSKLPSELEFEKNLIEKCQKNRVNKTSNLNALAILIDNQMVGFHTLNPIFEGDFGIFHAHIIKPNFRRKGIALYSYPKACNIFIDRFNLNRILFKTPVQNIGSIRVKEKLGIRYIGEEIVGFGLVKDGTLAKVFELTAKELKYKFL